MKAWCSLGAMVALCSAWAYGAAEPGANGYLARLTMAVDGIGNDLPTLIQSAEAAARRFVEGQQEISVWGDAGFIEEALARAGGTMAVKPGRVRKDGPLCEIMLVAPRADNLEKIISATVTNRASGGLVIGFARADVIERARKTGAAFDFVVDTHVEKEAVPLDLAAQNTALWVWTAEFVSACTRLGVMPTMYQSVQVPGSKERNAAVQGMRIATNPVAPVAAGRLGEAYLKALRDRLAFLSGIENAKIREAAKRASAARRAGRTAYAHLHGHSVMHTLKRPDNPGLLADLGADWDKPGKNVVLKAGDFILMVGYDWLCQGTHCHDLAAKAREAGVGVAWCFTDYRKEEVAAVAAGEIWINQHWELGDAEVTVPGYDVKILPISGVISEAVLGMVEAEMMALGETAPVAASGNDVLFVATPFTREKEFTGGIEGPACDAAGNIYAVNFTREGTIGRVTPEGQGELFLELPGKSVGNGIRFDAAGRMYIADYVNHNVLLVEPGTKALSVFVHEPGMNQPNDLAITEDGTLYASDPAWNQGTGQIWRIDRRGKATLAATGLGTTNGIEVGPDNKTLYVNESRQRNIWAFVIAADGTLGDRRLVRRFEDHGFDGMRCDVDGNLYVTRPGKGTVLKMSPTGETLREIDVLGKHPTNLCFGGSDGRTVYVTEVEHRRLVQFRVDRPGLEWERARRSTGGTSAQP